MAGKWHPERIMEELKMLSLHTDLKFMYKRVFYNLRFKSSVLAIITTPYLPTLPRIHIAFSSPIFLLPCLPIWTNMKFTRKYSMADPHYEIKSKYFNDEGHDVLTVQMCRFNRNICYSF